MLHLPRLLRRSTEKENAAGQSVEPVYRPQVLQVVLLGENEHDRVVAVPPARVHLQSQYPRDLFAEKTALEAGEERERREDDRVKNTERRARKAGKDYCIIVFAEELDFWKRWIYFYCSPAPVSLRTLPAF